MKGYRVPGTGYRIPGTGYRVPGNRHGSGRREMELSTHRISHFTTGTWYPAPGTL